MDPLCVINLGSYCWRNGSTMCN